MTYKIEGYNEDKKVEAGYFEKQTKWIVGSIPFHKNKTSDIMFFERNKFENMNDEDIELYNFVQKYS